MSLRPQFVELATGPRRVRIEYAWIEAARPDAPVMVFLHEGLGSLAMWKDWPENLCAAGGYRGLVYSREGYGQSTARPAHERWPVEFMHTQALDVLPRVLDQTGATSNGVRPWLFGHSDGASIALIHAAHASQRLSGVIAVAPHIMVEDLSVRSIEQARDAYATTDLRDRLARYHADPDSAFLGWNDVWLDPEFRSWSIEAMLGRITCPVLAIQGQDDEYGTLAQIEGIAQRVRQAELIVLQSCGHSPHRDQPAALERAVVNFVARHEQVLTHHGGTQ